MIKNPTSSGPLPILPECPRAATRPRYARLIRAAWRVGIHGNGYKTGCTNVVERYAVSDAIVSSISVAIGCES